MNAVCLHPFSGAIIEMPLAMIDAYVPYGIGLKLEEAAQMAILQDGYEAEQLLLSIFDCDFPIYEGLNLMKIA